MSVLVKGMNMPKKGCCGCPLRTGRYCGQMTENELVQQYVERYERHPDCPLVEIPTPHGRLIDGDYLYKKFVANECPDSNVLMFVKEEPTVIEAEADHDTD